MKRAEIDSLLVHVPGLGNEFRWYVYEGTYYSAEEFFYLLQRDECNALFSGLVQ